MKGLRLDEEEVPFEAPTPRFVRTRKLIRRITRKRDKPPSEMAIGIFVLGYGFGALGVHHFDHRFLLFAWLMTAPLVISVYLTFEDRASLLNPYNAICVLVIVASVALYFLDLPPAVFIR